MQHTTIAVDLAKSVFQVAISHRPGQVDEEHRLSRGRFLKFFATRPAATVLLEACGSSHHWGRELERLGHTVQLLPPHDVHRYVRRNKTDRADAKALLEAARNDEIHPVPVKAVSQQAVASLHRIRSTWQGTRTARLNLLRGLLREFGVTIPVGAHHVVPRVRARLEDADAPLPWAHIDAALVQVPRGIRFPTRWSRRPQLSHNAPVNSRVHPKYKTRYRVGNWPAYERALVQRGDVTL